MPSFPSPLSCLAALRWHLSAAACGSWVYAALHCRSPYLLRFREPGLWAFAALGIIAVFYLISVRRRIRTGFNPFHLLAAAAIIGGTIAPVIHWQHHRNRGLVGSLTRETMPALGNHLIIGWLGFDETLSLASRGAIRGVFLTRRAFPPGSTVRDIRHVVDQLQQARHKAGLPPLWIATDQEGGPVSKLTPMIASQPALGSLLADLDGPGLAADPARAVEIERRVAEYAEIQGKALAETGINLNFAPVVDLRPEGPPGKLDFQSRIATRALGSDPAVVALAGKTYVRTLARHGVTAVIKHFPGLGRIPEDTHHFAANTDATPDDLASSDWLPFREITAQTDAAIMLGHVRVNSVDSKHNASSSSAVMRGLLRGQWGFKGLLVTDDFAMAPVSHGPGGIARATRNSMAAGVDLILLSYDPEAVYDLLATTR